MVDRKTILLRNSRTPHRNYDQRFEVAKTKKHKGQTRRDQTGSRGDRCTYEKERRRHLEDALPVERSQWPYSCRLDHDCRLPAAARAGVGTRSAHARLLQNSLQHKYTPLRSEQRRWLMSSIRRPKNLLRRADIVSRGVPPTHARRRMHAR